MAINPKLKREAEIQNLLKRLKTLTTEDEEPTKFKVDSPDLESKPMKARDYQAFVDQQNYERLQERMNRKGIFSRLKFWKKEKNGKRNVLTMDQREAQDRFVRLESFLNEECKNKCYMCPNCIKKLESVVK